MKYAKTKVLLLLMACCLSTVYTMPDMWLALVQGHGLAITREARADAYAEAMDEARMGMRTAIEECSGEQFFTFYSEWWQAANEYTRATKSDGAYRIPGWVRNAGSALWDQYHSSCVTFQPVPVSTGA